ncbi:MAG: XrtA/PEP-CTERM system-associated ATPase [Aquabacterium sp.]
MFESHFGLHAAPFQLSPDPGFYFDSRGHGEALAYLKYGVYQREGFIVVTGEIGAGKTTLVRTLLSTLDPRQIVSAQIVNTQLDEGELLAAICTAFGVPTDGSSKPRLIATLEAFFTAVAAGGRRALLVVDEAQNLGIRGLEELRMLSNFQLENQALLQSFLVGQPQLRRMLVAPEMEQLRQRVIASCHLMPLGVSETRQYIEHRLRQAGCGGQTIFEPDAFLAIHTHSGGVPRRINLLCNRLMLAAYLVGRHHVDAAAVDFTAHGLEAELGAGSAAALG